MRQEVFKDHIKQHNVYAKNNYYVEPEKLEDFLNTEHQDVVQATLNEFKEKRMETEHRILELMDSRLAYLKDVEFQEILWASKSFQEVSKNE